MDHIAYQGEDEESPQELRRFVSRGTGNLK